MLGNIMQQLYNLADTWIFGRYIGDNALAAVGSSYTLITFLTSVIIGLSLGKGLCYIGIGILFMLYGYYRAVNKPLMSVVLMIFHSEQECFWRIFCHRTCIRSYGNMDCYIYRLIYCRCSRNRILYDQRKNAQHYDKQ